MHCWGSRQHIQESSGQTPILKIFPPLNELAIWSKDQDLWVYLQHCHLNFLQESRTDLFVDRSHDDDVMMMMMAMIKYAMIIKSHLLNKENKHIATQYYHIR